ncbi:MAG: phosphoserine phosphatase SerB [Actinomycetia bacterium]|nr:phosphoserine phosphatase SerB [Actinomycetes bacterium]
MPWPRPPSPVRGPESPTMPTPADDPGEPIRETVLVQVTGPDQPGITAGLLDLLALHDVTIEDVEQIVARDRLNLDLVVNIPATAPVLKDLLFFGWQRGVSIDFEVVDGATAETGARSVVTVLGSRLGPTPLGSVAHAIADSGGNIDRILRIARYPVTCYELVVSGATIEDLRTRLVTVSHDERIDIAIQAEGLGRRAKRLVVLDVDSTLIQNEVIELVAAEGDCLAEVEELTTRAMAGELQFEDSLRQRVRLMAGIDTSALDAAWDNLVLTPGARTFVRTLRRLGFTVAIVSGGFDFFTDRLKDELGLDHAFANTLEIANGKLTGNLAGPVVDRARKAELLRQVAASEGVPIEQTVAIGDGANDLDMIAAAGLGVAFNARPVVREVADTSVTVPYLDAILFMLGVSREEVEAADAADGIQTVTPPVN